MVWRRGGRGGRTSGQGGQLEGRFAHAPLVADGALFVVVEEVRRPHVHGGQVADDRQQPEATTGRQGRHATPPPRHPLLFANCFRNAQIFFD